MRDARRSAGGEPRTRALVRHAAPPGRRGARAGQGRDPQDRRPGRPGRQGARPRGAARVHRPAHRRRRCSSGSARGPPRPPRSWSSGSGTPRSSWRAPATTTRSWSTRPARSTGPPPRSRRSSPRRSAATRIDGCASSLDRMAADATLFGPAGSTEAPAAAVDARRRGGRRHAAGRGRGRCAGRAGCPDVHLPRPGSARRPGARRGGARPVRQGRTAVAGRRPGATRRRDARGRPGDGSAPARRPSLDRRARPRRRAARPAADARAGPLDRGPLPRAGGDRRCARCCRPGCSSGSRCSPRSRRPARRCCASRPGSDPAAVDLLDELGVAAATRARPRQPGGPGRAAAPAARAGGRWAAGADPDARHGGTGPALRAAAAPDAGTGATSPARWQPADESPGRPLGPRQVAALAELLADPVGPGNAPDSVDQGAMPLGNRRTRRSGCGACRERAGQPAQDRGRDRGGRARRAAAPADDDADAAPRSAGVPAAPLAERHGASALAGLVRRGLLDAWIRERPRRPLAGRRPGLRGGRPAASAAHRPQARGCGPRPRGHRPSRPDAAPPRRRHRRRQDGDLRRGDRRRRSSRAARRSSSSRRSRSRPRSSTACAPTSRPGSRSSTRACREGERADEWRRIRSGDVDLVVGTRIAVTAPLEDVGLVIVDEEHEPGVQERPHTALRRPRHGHPAGRARRRRGRAGVSRRRPSRASGTARGGAVPARRAAGPRERHAADDRGRRPARGARRRQPRAALGRCCVTRCATSTREHGEQAILVINRRGTASVVLCRDCGHVQACPDCDRPLVYHHAGTTLRCHHCGRATPARRPLPARAGRRASAISAAARSASSARSARRSRSSASAAWIATSWSGGARPTASSTTSPAAAWTCSSGPSLVDEGPRRPDRDAGRHRVRRRRPQPARRARRGADVPVPGPGDRPSRARRAARPRDRPDVPARTTARSGPSSRTTRPRSTTRSSRSASAGARRRSDGW